MHQHTLSDQERATVEDYKNTFREELPRSGTVLEHCANLRERGGIDDRNSNICPLAQRAAAELIIEIAPDGGDNWDAGRTHALHLDIKLGNVPVTTY